MQIVKCQAASLVVDLELSERNLLRGCKSRVYREAPSPMVLSKVNSLFEKIACPFFLFSGFCAESQIAEMSSVKHRPRW